MAGSTSLQSAWAASSSRPIWSRSRDKTGALNSLPLKRGSWRGWRRRSRRCPWLPEFAPRGDELGGACAAFNRSVKAPQGSPTSPANMEKRQRERKDGDGFRVVAAFQRLGDAGQAGGDLRVARAVRRVGSSDSGSSQTALRRARMAGSARSVSGCGGCGVRERGVGGAGAAEFGIDLDDAADVDNEQEGRPALFGGQRPA